MKMMEHNGTGILEKSQFSQQDVINFQKGDGQNKKRGVILGGF